MFSGLFRLVACMNAHVCRNEDADADVGVTVSVKQ
jgi:hypothetical protein